MRSATRKRAPPTGTRLLFRAWSYDQHRFPDWPARRAAGRPAISIFQRADVAVSPARQSFDVARFLGRIAQHFANARDCVVQAVVKIDEGICRPDPALQFLPGTTSPARSSRISSTCRGWPRRRSLTPCLRSSPARTSSSKPSKRSLAETRGWVAIGCLADRKPTTVRRSAHPSGRNSN